MIPRDTAPKPSPNPNPNPNEGPGARDRAGSADPTEPVGGSATPAARPSHSGGGPGGLERARRLAESILDRSPGSGGPPEGARDGAPGRLPTERVLAAEHGVTRAAVRDALAVLAAEGRISREVGRGTFRLPPAVSLIPPRSLAPRPAADISPADVLAARRLLEPELLPLVVVRATERDLLEIERCAEEGGRARSTEEFERWDLALHHKIAMASHNPLLLRMYEAIEDARQGEIWGNLKRRGDSPERRAERHGEHRRIVEALRAREVHAAVSAMDHHLERVTISMLGEPSARLSVGSPASA